MNSKDKQPKLVAKVQQKHKPPTTANRRTPHIGTTIQGSSSSSSEEKFKPSRSNSKSKPKSSAKSSYTSKQTTSKKHLDELEQNKGDTYLKEMASSSLRTPDKNQSPNREYHDEAEQETDLDLDTSFGELSELLTSDRVLSSSSSATPVPNEEQENYCHDRTEKLEKALASGSVDKSKDNVILCHDDEEINQQPKTSSEEDDCYETGAALTIADETNESTFVVYPLGCCEFDETQLVSATSTKAIQKCILRLLNKPKKEETTCWGLDQSQPILMRLFEEYIQFTDLKSKTLLRSQPIRAIKTWAVDDDNNFAFVVEDTMSNQSIAGNNYYESVDFALLTEPCMMCYIFRSIDDDDMSCKVAAKLNEEINLYKEQMSYRISKSNRMQQMLEPDTHRTDDPTDVEDFDDLESSSELTMHVKYIGKTPVPRPVGIDVLNIAIDKCLAESSKSQLFKKAGEDQQVHSGHSSAPSSGLQDVKLHVSPSSVIVENETTGEILVECRIRYLTFMGISRRDIRWCGFIMQNTNNKTFMAHCFECHPTAGHVCDAIQASCTKMYQKVVKNCRQPDTASIIPTRYTIRDTLAKTLSRIKLNPIR